MIRALKWTLMTAFAAFVGCDPGRPDAFEVDQKPLDDMYTSPKDMSLLVLENGTEWSRVVEVVEELGGQVFHIQPPRMLVAKLPKGVDAALAGVGLEQRYDRAVGPEEIPGASVPESRFVRVFSNRYYRTDLPAGLRIASVVKSTERGGAWEREASFAPAVTPFASRAPTSLESQLDSESWVYVPYAAGTVVVAVWLPESNGVGEPSTEDWTEEQILGVYDKIQTALEAIRRHEPNSKLHFILHYESAPAEGGLVGTIDHDWEFGKQANWGSGGDEWRSIGQMLSRVLGREITDTWTAQHEYLNSLRDRYNADAAFYVAVAGNGNGTASLRAHAYFNGPGTVLDSQNYWEVFMHEFGHIFGAADEYCPDACTPPNTLAGYLGMINANATYRADGQSGINNGQGEDQPSLMMYNVVNSVNGYTRGAWGWLDTDADGLIEVIDTLPSSTDLKAIDDNGTWRLKGLITDVPATPLWHTPFSVNRIRSLEYRFADRPASPWFELPIEGRTRGREQVDIAFTPLSLGQWTLELRAVNSAGNTEQKPHRVVMSGTAVNTAPHVRFRVEPKVGSTRTSFRLSAEALDQDGDPILTRFDADGDGLFETGFGEARTTTTRFSRPGRYRLQAEVSDGTNARAVPFEVFVLDQNTPPSVELLAPASPQHGTDSMTVDLQAAVSDADGEPVELNWIVEVGGVLAYDERIESGFRPDTSFRTVLRTPTDLAFQWINFQAATGVNPVHIEDIKPVGGDILAVAMGSRGLALVDIKDRAAPRLVSQLNLETSARRLHVEGDRLLVLGGQLALVDISDPARPMEIRQIYSTTHTRSSDVRFDQPVSPEEPMAYQKHFFDTDEKIADILVKVEVAHTDPGRLTFVLGTDKEVGLGDIVLRERVPGPAGRRTYTFTTENTPALKSAIGLFSRGPWHVAVQDSGEKNPRNPHGVLAASSISLRTVHRAVEVLPNPRDVVGVMDESFAVVVGDGVQLIDTTLPSFAAPVGFLPGTTVMAAVLEGSNLLVASGVAAESEKSMLDCLFGCGSGLYAVDLSFPYLPQIRRIEPGLFAFDLAVFGDRYYTVVQDQTTWEQKTQIGDLGTFLAGGDYVLGETTVPVHHGSLAEGQRITTWDNAGRITVIDANDPADVRIVQAYARPSVEGLFPLPSGELFVRSWNGNGVVDLHNTRSTTSRVFQVTLEARDAWGATTTVIRNLHLVPYSHPPAIDGVEILSGKTEIDDWTIRVHVADPDADQGWDPHIMVAADQDGDGRVDTPWIEQYAAEAATLYLHFPAPGLYPVTFFARDGFYGVSPVQTSLIEVAAWTPVACGGAHANTCQDDEYCFVEGMDACGDREGVCVKRSGTCEVDPSEQPFCGCDHQTYYSHCNAKQNGVNALHAGECPIVQCSTNEECFDNQYCLFETNPDDPALSCGGDGKPGICTILPTDCYYFKSLMPPHFRRVCGCDGQTYVSACAANQAGVSIAKWEPCEPPPPDCTTTGCEEGQVCMFCWAHYTCMPEGAIC